MFTHVLTPVDGSELSMMAARHGIELAKLCNAKLTSVMVTPTFRQLSQDGFTAPAVKIVRERWEEDMQERAEKILEQICIESGRAGVKCDSVHLFGDSPYVAIIDTAKEKGCDVIVMGSHGYGGFKQFVLGSETGRVLSHSTIPVVVYR
jgi:nucleotide-binding universal stress UspA family protein